MDQRTTLWRRTVLIQELGGRRGGTPPSVSGPGRAARRFAADIKLAKCHLSTGRSIRDSQHHGGPQAARGVDARGLCLPPVNAGPPTERGTLSSAFSARSDLCGAGTASILAAHHLLPARSLAGNRYVLLRGPR